MNNVVQFPIKQIPPPVLDASEIHAHRVSTVYDMRAAILGAVKDTLIAHGADTDKPDIIAAAFVLALRDISNKSASPAIALAVAEQLLEGKK